MNRRLFVGAALVALTAAPLAAQDTYRLPPQEVVDILDAPATPFVRVSPDQEWLVLAHRKSMPSIADMSQPMLRIGGRRINPATNGSFSPSLTTGFSIMNVDDGTERMVELPYEDGWGFASFSPDGTMFYTTRDTDQGIELWLGDVEDASARRLLGPMLNGARGGACSWMRDSESLLCHGVLENRGAAPVEPAVPLGPVVQQNLGVVAPVRTYQDLLKNPHDVALYNYYMTSQPMLVDASTGNVTPLGVPGVYAGVSLSPSGEYFLAERRKGPYSYLVTDRSFPMDVEVWDRSGNVVARVADIPLRETTPIGGVEEGPRNFAWMAGEDHTLIYVEALDGGDPRASVDMRDKVMMLSAPFAGAGEELLRTEYRYAGMTRGEGDLALLYEYDRPSRMRRTWKLDLSGANDPVTLFEISSEDVYNDPGRPITAPNERGESIMVQNGDWIFLSGRGGSDDGDRPFLDRYNLNSTRTERLWRAEVGTYEDIVEMLDDSGRKILTQYQTPEDFPNYFIRDTRSGDGDQITAFANPHPQLSEVHKEFVTYERADGVPLSGTLYLPVGYEEGDKVPAVVWAYPREYADDSMAGQVRGSPYRFTRIGGYSHLFFLTQGYAILDGATIPIVGGDVANDTYVEQLVAGAQGAVDYLVDHGIAERDQIGVGGHSYGAFMTANLLAHSDIFAAGIARSGAYNRTLTPFGFQSEQRTFWEVPELYFEMSPFMHADQINEPMLMIHGIADNNSGTFPIQSERMYHAMKGHGATVRLVMLPNESHGYRGRESVMTALAEMIEWFDTYVKKRNIAFQ
jgi:dipeptidyl aminopeptidase/acylaminoacyl peptidase